MLTASIENRVSLPVSPGTPSNLYESPSQGSHRAPALVKHVTRALSYHSQRTVYTSLMDDMFLEAMYEERFELDHSHDFTYEDYREFHEADEGEDEDA